jgi:hypothetical protein
MADKDKGKKIRQSNAEKPISLRPLEFGEAVADILQVKPQLKVESKKKRQRKKT